MCADAGPVQDWILEEGSAKYPRCMLTSDTPLNMPGGEEDIDAIGLYLIFDGYPQKAAVAGLDTFGDDMFASYTSYTVSIVSAESPGEVFFSGEFLNENGWEGPEISFEETGNTPQSTVKLFARALFGDTPRNIFVDSPKGGAPMGPFPIDTGAIRKLFPQFMACVEKL